MSAVLQGAELAALIETTAAGAPDEVVTHALSRDVVLPHGAGTAVLITLDNGMDHTRPNSFGARGLAELDRALGAALARDDVAAVAVTGKPYILAAGADLSAIPKMTDRDRSSSGWSKPIAHEARPSPIREAPSPFSVPTQCSGTRSVKSKLRVMLSRCSRMKSRTFGYTTSRQRRPLKMP